MNLDAYMDGFGRDLERAAAARRRSRRRAARLLLPAVPALAFAFAVLPGSGPQVDAIAAARAALAPAGEIVHMKIRVDNGPSVPSRVSEQWYLAEPERWRTRVVVPRRPIGGTVLVDPATGQILAGRVEWAFRDERLRVYTSTRDVVTIFRSRQAHLPNSGLGGDPTTDLRAQLAQGGLRDEGVVTRDGREVRRLVRETQRPRGVTQVFVYDMDPATFAPIAGRVYFLRGGKPQPGGVEYRVEAYARLPLTERTERLLEIEKTPDTKFVWR